MPNKELKTVSLTPETKFLSIDVESNGLHGEAFAVGAVLVKADGSLLDEFTGRAPIKGEVDPWVTENVLPAMVGIPENHKDAKALRAAFWQWYKQAKQQADYVLVDNGYPVEARFLISCQDEDIDDRFWDHPFPLLDLSSMLLQLGFKPLSERNQFVADEIDSSDIQKHNPRWDAWVSARAMLKAMRLAGRLSD